MRTHNFFAGPAILPPEVLKTAQDAVNDFQGMGLSILEISHRCADFVDVMDEGEQLVRDLLRVPDGYSVLWLTGGASSQFYMAPMNLLMDGNKAGYVNTGTWANKAIAEGKKFGQIVEVASSANSNYNYVPKGYEVDEGLKYLHLTSNNTIFGTELHEEPRTTVPLVADMSSNIFSRVIDIDRYDLIYAGAQKNLGPAGTTLVLVKNDVLGKTGRQIPTMLDYRTHIDKKSSFNTPPVFPIYVCVLTLRWIKEQGGVAALESRNIKKAELLYNEIDRNSLFVGTAEKEDRSRMNVCFLAIDDKTENAFIAEAEKHKLLGLAGHRSVGGFRASIYNAMPMESVQLLIEVMQDFEKKHG